MRLLPQIQAVGLISPRLFPIDRSFHRRLDRRHAKDTGRMARSENNEAHGSGNVPVAPAGTAMAVGGGGAPAAGSGKQEYRTASADCAVALNAYYAHTMVFGYGRGPTVLRAAAADPSCVLASALAAPRDPARAAPSSPPRLRESVQEDGVSGALCAGRGGEGRGGGNRATFRAAEGVPHGSHVFEGSAAHVLLHGTA